MTNEDIKQLREFAELWTSSKRESPSRFIAEVIIAEFVLSLVGDGGELPADYEWATANYEIDPSDDLLVRAAIINGLNRYKFRMHAEVMNIKRRKP